MPLSHYSPLLPWTPLRAIRAQQHFVWETCTDDMTHQHFFYWCCFQFSPKPAVMAMLCHAHTAACKNTQLLGKDQSFANFIISQSYPKQLCQDITQPSSSIYILIRMFKWILTQK